MTPNINPNPTPDPRQGVSSDITRLNRQGIARDVEHAREVQEAQRETAAADTRQARRDKADRVDLSKAARTYEKRIAQLNDFCQHSLTRQERNHKSELAK